MIDSSGKKTSFKIQLLKIKSSSLECSYFQCVMLRTWCIKTRQVLEKKHIIIVILYCIVFVFQEHHFK